MALPTDFRPPALGTVPLSDDSRAHAGAWDVDVADTDSANADFCLGLRVEKMEYSDGYTRVLVEQSVHVVFPNRLASEVGSLDTRSRSAGCTGGRRQRFWNTANAGVGKG